MMEKVFEFLNKNRYGNLATSIGNQPYVRPFEYTFSNDKGIFFYTSDNKDVFKQLKSNPNISFCATDQNHNYVELTGEIQFTEDINFKKRILKESEYAKKTYRDESNSHLRVFHMTKGKAIIHDNNNNNSERFNFQ